MISTVCHCSYSLFKLLLARVCVWGGGGDGNFNTRKAALKMHSGGLHAMPLSMLSLRHPKRIHII